MNRPLSWIRQSRGWNSVDVFLQYCGHLFVDCLPQFFRETAAKHGPKIGWKEGPSWHLSRHRQTAGRTWQRTSRFHTRRGTGLWRSRIMVVRVALCGRSGTSVQRGPGLIRRTYPQLSVVQNIAGRTLERIRQGRDGLGMARGSAVTGCWFRDDPLTTTDVREDLRLRPARRTK